MAERPIPMSAPMVRALLDGTKTQTRRVVKNHSGRYSETIYVSEDEGKSWWPYASDDCESHICYDGNERPMASPYGAPGDRLWVREAWRTLNVHDHVPPRELTGAKVSYDADTLRTEPSMWWGKRRPGMFMPRWASRITLEVTGVRVERLQDISEADAFAEGCVATSKFTPNVRDDYAALWESINGPGSWGANPWVWVVEFKRLTP